MVAAAFAEADEPEAARRVRELLSHAARGLEMEAGAAGSVDFDLTLAIKTLDRLARSAVSRYAKSNVLGALLGFGPLCARHKRLASLFKPYRMSA